MICGSFSSMTSTSSPVFVLAEQRQPERAVRDFMRQADGHEHMGGSSEPEEQAEP
jgi:hypothetical protein